MTSIRPGDKILIKRNLREEMEKLGFSPRISQEFQDRYASTVQTAHAFWKDEDTQTTFATIDLCCEIPIQCCEPA